MSEADVGGMAVCIELFHHYSVTCYCYVAGGRGAVWQNTSLHGYAHNLVEKYHRLPLQVSECNLNVNHCHIFHNNYSFRKPFTCSIIGQSGQDKYKFGISLLQVINYCQYLLQLLDDWLFFLIAAEDRQNITFFYQEP